MLARFRRREGKKHDIAIEAYGPTSPAFRFDGNRGNFDAVLEEVSKAVAQRAGKDKVEPSQVLLRLAAQRGAIVITTSGKDWRMKECVSLCLFALSCVSLRALARFLVCGRDAGLTCLCSL